VIERRLPVPVAVPLGREAQELDVAIELVASGAARRVVVAGLTHVPELIVRMRGRAASAGVLLRPLEADAPRSVIVVGRPVVLI
jgi:hypothetical protein